MEEIGNVFGDPEVNVYTEFPEHNYWSTFGSVLLGRTSLGAHTYEGTFLIVTFTIPLQIFTFLLREDPNYLNLIVPKEFLGLDMYRHVSSVGDELLFTLRV